jgi:hypothetical protein
VEINIKTERKHRGLYGCKKTGKKINADINAALNIARRLGYRVRVSRKIESYLVTHSGVKPLNPLQGANTRDPCIETPPLKSGEGSSPIIDIAICRFSISSLPTFFT